MYSGQHGRSSLDASTNRVVTTLTGIEGPHNLQVAPDGKSVWAVSGYEALAVIIDVTTYAVHGVVPTGKEPAHVILTPDDQTVYVANAKDTTLSVIDTQTHRNVADIAVGERPVQVAFSLFAPAPTVLKVNLEPEGRSGMEH